MKEKKYKIAFTGVYEIENYGDHLFPLIFEKVMKTKGLEVELFLFSPIGGMQGFGQGKTVYKLSELEEIHEKICFDAVVVGGGGIFHYVCGSQKLNNISEEFINYPVFETWVIPSLFALKHNIKIIWNLLGGYQEFPDFYQHLTKALCTSVDYLSVRDQYTKDIVCGCGIEQDKVNVFLDSAFLMKKYISKEFLKTVREELNIIPDKYIIYHANRSLEDKDIKTLINCLEDLRKNGYEIVLLPLAYTHDDESILAKINKMGEGKYIEIKKHLTVYEIMAIIAGAELYVGVSFHGAVTAACYGKRIIAYDYMYNGKTKDLFQTLEISQYYVTEVEDLSKAIHRIFTETEEVVDLDKKIANLDVHFDNMIEVIKEKKEPKDLKNFIENFSLMIDTLTKYYGKSSALEKKWLELNEQYSITFDSLHATLYELEKAKVELENLKKTNEQLYFENEELNNKINQNENK